MSRIKRSRIGTREELPDPVKKVKLAQKPSAIPSRSKSSSFKSNTPKAKPLKKFEETELDSDPIVESDTQSESGADDGVSWPSDEETRDPEIVAEDEGGVELPTNSQNQKENDNGLCIHNLFLLFHPANLHLLATSRESHQKQKAIAQERKAAKPNADAFARSKKIWERLRLQSHVPLPERKKLIAELFEIITGRIKDFVLKHDASRVIQTALKYGNLEQRKMIARELKGTYCELAQSKFAKHAIGKILVHGDDEIRDIVIPEFYGNVRKLIKHPEAAWILDDVYRGAATSQQKAILLREWYGAEFAIFKSTEKVTSDLTEMFKIFPEKKTTILRYLFELINQLIQKKTTGFTMLHDAMLQYYVNVRGTDTATEFLEVVKGDEEGDLLKNLAFTKSGARLVSLFLAYGSAKDRKQLLKAYKGVVPAMAFDAHAHKVLLVALDVIDDTRLTSKSIYGELFPPPSDSDEAVTAAHISIIEAGLHLYGRSSTLYPFIHKLQSILPKDTEAILSETRQIRNETSKKDPEIRRQELAKSIAPQLLAAIPTQIINLIPESFGCQFITEILLSSTSDVVNASLRTPSLDALLNTIKDPSMADKLSTPQVGRMLKSLVLSGHFNSITKSIETCNPPLGFADKLFETIQDNILIWATGVNSFVIVGMAESQDLSGENRTALGKKLNDGKEKLKKAAAGDDVEVKGKGNKGAGILIAMIEKGEL